MTCQKLSEPVLMCVTVLPVCMMDTAYRFLFLSVGWARISMSSFKVPLCHDLGDSLPLKPSDDPKHLLLEGH